jgi:hypothetical protein
MRKNAFRLTELESDWTRTSKIRPVAGEYSGSDRRSYGWSRANMLSRGKRDYITKHLRSSTNCNPATEAAGNCKEDVGVKLVLRSQKGRQWQLLFCLMMCQLQ